MSAIVFDKDSEYLAWVAKHEDRWVLNVSNTFRSRYMVLHRANCRTISHGQNTGAFTERNYRKVCAHSINELSAWVARNGRPDGDFSLECAKCNPRGVVNP